MKAKTGHILKIMSDRVHVENKNVILIIVGETGSGKSWASLRIAERLDPKFTIDNVVFDVVSFINAVENAKKGTAIVFDEVGIGASNRSSMSNINKAVSALAQSFRHRNTFNILTLPSFDMVDKHLRQLAHFQIETIMVANDKCLTKFKTIQNNPGYGKVYRKYVHASNDTVITRLNINKPSKRLIDPYEKKKVEFTTALYNELRTKVITKDKEPVAKLSTDDYVERVLKNPGKYIDHNKTTGKPKFSDILIRRHLGVGDTYVRVIRQTLTLEHGDVLEEY